MTTDLVQAIQSRGVPYEASSSGRWVKLLTPHGDGIYLQEYSWSEDCRKHYLIFSSQAGGASQQMVGSLDEALALGIREWARASTLAN